ncbi:MAG: hypothetical protein H7067_14320 [Burkholderiales bacterium]|nr:hypothetical protein [Opitutaceae bacterium]
MALKRIRFVWDTPPLPDGRWRLGLLNLQHTPDPARPLPPGGVPAYWKGYLHHTLNLSVRGLFAWGAGAAVCAYFAAAGLLYLRHERANPHNRIGYLDLLLPSRWDDRERLQGEGFILLGREKLAAGRFSEGFDLLRIGLEKNPSDSAARLDLARIYAAMRLRPQAEKILRTGLELGYPGRIYLETAFALAADGDQPAQWFELCELARARLDELPEAEHRSGDSLWLDQQTAKALFADGRAPEAAALATARYPDAHPFRREITVLALLQDEEAPAALALATVWAAEQPRAPEPKRKAAPCSARSSVQAGAASAAPSPASG